MFISIYRKKRKGRGGNISPRRWAAGLLLYLAGLSLPAQAETITCAVASNFANTLKIIAKEFETTTGHTVRIVSGSTGKLYAQIMHGAPFDVFLSADARRPQLLEKQKQIEAGSRFIYAQGQLALWTHRSSLPGSDALDVFKKGTFQRLALANPKTAPYGQAAREVLMQFGLWNSLRKKMVRGENIGQAFQFTATGNADLGLVALSQVKDPKLKIKGAFLIIDSRLHSPIHQEAVLLKGSKHANASREFLEFLKGERSLNILHRYGYLTH